MPWWIDTMLYTWEPKKKEDMTKKGSSAELSTRWGVWISVEKARADIEAHAVKVLTPSPTKKDHK